VYCKWMEHHSVSGIGPCLDGELVSPLPKVSDSVEQDSGHIKMGDLGRGDMQYYIVLSWCLDSMTASLKRAEGC